MTHQARIKITRKSALFLDRDGVINRRLVGEYVRNWDEFEFLPGVFESLKIFNGLFSRIFIVTNQQGIGKGLMTGDDLALIHQRMLKEISRNGGRIDRIYYCPDLAGTGSKFRKPRPGMALQAAAEFPDIHLESSVMVGDGQGDIGFASNAGMQSVFIEAQSFEMQNLNPQSTLIVKDLLSFALLIQEQNKTV